MHDLVTVTGMILKSEPIAEYDRRLVILTLQRGKITCFAKGARKQGSKFMAATNVFCFGEFTLYEGRSSYSLNNVLITNYFEELRQNFEGACYGMYFLELMDYYTLENADEVSMLKLLYQSVRALIHDAYDNRLIRSIVELKTLVLNGEYAGIKDFNTSFLESTIYTLKFIETTPPEKLFSFGVKEEVLKELEGISRTLIEKNLDRNMKSAEILDNLLP